MSKDPSQNLSLKRKHMARLAAVQYLYAQMIDPAFSATSYTQWLDGLGKEDKILPLAPDAKLLRGLLCGTSEMQEALQTKLASVLGKRWEGNRMPKLMRAIFLAAAYELIYTPKLHAMIIIDQYVGVADALLDDNDIGFVHGALHELTQHIRPDHGKDHA